MANNWKSGSMRMKVAAEILTGSLFYVEVGEDATVGDLKNEIGKQENFPRDRLILLLDAAEERYSLDKDETRIKDYGVEDGSHIYIFFQPEISIASSVSPSTPKESASSEPSNGPADEPPHQENPSNQPPPASVDQEE